MSEFKSARTAIQRSAEGIYDFLSDFNNFQHLIPADRVKNYESTKETCSFSVEGMPAFHLKMGENIPVSNVTMIPQQSSGVDFALTTNIEQVSPSGCEVTIILTAELNAFMKMMAAKPLQTFVDTLAEKLKIYFEQ